MFRKSRNYADDIRGVLNERNKRRLVFGVVVVFILLIVIFGSLPINP